MTLARRSRDHHHTVNVWPGWVDALAALIMVVVFVLLIFVIAQFHLQNALTGKDRTLDEISAKLAELNASLIAATDENSELRISNEDFALSLKETSDRNFELMTNIRDLTDRLDKAIAKKDETNLSLLKARDDLMARLAEIESRDAKLQTLETEKEEAVKAAQTMKTAKAETDAQILLLNSQIVTLRAQIARLNGALDAADAAMGEQKIEIESLNQRLNLALLEKVEEMERYRSEFFGRLREVLGNRDDIQIRGDRFIFQSEVLFPSGTAILQGKGQAQLDNLAKTLLDIAAKIPADVNWILRVDGHTDKRPISTELFPSNWQLSTARAISVVRYLMESGVPSDRLAATGFAEYHPLDPANTEEAYARNRRIEIKLDRR